MAAINKMIHRRRCRSNNASRSDVAVGYGNSADRAESSTVIEFAVIGGSHQTVYLQRTDRISVLHGDFHVRIEVAYSTFKISRKPNKSRTVCRSTGLGSSAVSGSCEMAMRVEYGLSV